LIKSNEHIAQLQREHEIELEQKREILMEKDREQEHLHHLAEQVVQRNITYEFLQRMEELSEKNREEEQSHQWALEQQRASIADQYRREDQNRQGEYDLNKFFDKTDLHNSSRATLQRKILSLIRHLNPFHKTVLIKTLYEENLLHRQCNPNTTLACNLELAEADLSGLQLGKRDESKLFQYFLNNFQSVIVTETCPSVQYNGLNLPRTILVNASFDCLLLDAANFMQANLSKASFYRSRLYNASLSSTDMNECNFQEAKMDELSLSRISLLGAQFQRASLIGAQLLFIQGNGSDFRQANLVKTSWMGSILPDAKFDYANINEITFHNADLKNASFYKAFGENSNFWMAEITNTSFREASLPQSEFLSAKGIGADFSEAILHGSNFRFTELDNCLFYNASMNNISFFAAQITKGNFRHASLIGSDFSRADLTDSDFSRADFRKSEGLTDDQLNNTFSISNAILPNGTRGENRNLIRYGHPICANTTMVMNRSEWIVSSPASLIIIHQSDINSCVFRSATSNITSMFQSIDISRYAKRMIDTAPTNILIKIELLFGQIKANLRLFNRNHDLTDEGL
jgi:uncharacterized protein YjbI with pentapeptide repeats